jgi:hypothetical protein
MVKQNQGYRKDLNLEENPNDTLALNNLGGAGIANDLRIIQNNLRNTSSLSYDSLSDGFFSFPNNEFVYTNNDVVGVSTSVNVGSTTLTVGTEYFVCNSNGETRFKLSTTPSSSGLSTVIVTGVGTTAFSFIRKDPVTQDNIINYITPEIQDDENFTYLDETINDTFLNVSANNESSRYFIGRKYRSDEDTNTDRDLNFEGIISINDPVRINETVSGLSTSKSPGVFIGDTRAFSSDNNPWLEVGTALSTVSVEVSIAELNFSDDIVIEGLTPTDDTSVLASSFTHKLPVIINGETYYLLLRT